MFLILIVGVDAVAVVGFVIGCWLPLVGVCRLSFVVCCVLCVDCWLLLFVCLFAC